MKTQHTPTPWVMKEGLGLGSKYFIGESLDGKHTPFQSTKKANAAFIVEVCNNYDRIQVLKSELLEALLTINGCPDSRCHACNCVLKQAIAKAEGKA